MPRFSQVVEEQLAARRRGAARHAAIEQSLAELRALVDERGHRIAALEEQVVALSTLLVEHRIDDKRHVGKLFGGGL